MKMRTVGTLQTTLSSMTTPPPKPPFSPPPQAAATLQHSPWNSPVPYLFGGLAAMLGLIAFALLVLACSYWKLSDRMNTADGQGGEGDMETGGEKDGGGAIKHPLPIFEEKIVVIMAGDVNPTFLATPTFTTDKDSSFGKSDQNEEKEMDQKPKNQISERFDHRITENTDQHVNREDQEFTLPGQELNH